MKKPLFYKDVDCMFNQISRVFTFVVLFQVIVYANELLSAEDSFNNAKVLIAQYEKCPLNGLEIYANKVAVLEKQCLLLRKDNKQLQEDNRELVAAFIEQGEKHVETVTKIKHDFECKEDQQVAAMYKTINASVCNLSKENQCLRNNLKMTQNKLKDRERLICRLESMVYSKNNIKKKNKIRRSKKPEEKLNKKSQ